MRPIDADAIVFDYNGLAYIGPYNYMDIAKYFADQIARQPTLTPPNDPLKLEDAKKERYIWFTPLNDWGKVTPFGVLFFGSEELMTWETLCEEWGYRFKAYRRPPEGEEDA